MKPQYLQGLLHNVPAKNIAVKGHTRIHKTHLVLCSGTVREEGGTYLATFSLLFCITNTLYGISRYRYKSAKTYLQGCRISRDSFFQVSGFESSITLLFESLYILGSFS